MVGKEFGHIQDFPVNDDPTVGFGVVLGDLGGARHVCSKLVVWKLCVLSVGVCCCDLSTLDTIIDAEESLYVSETKKDK